MQFGNRVFFNTASTFGKALTTINAQVDEAAMFDRVGRGAPHKWGRRVAAGRRSMGAKTQRSLLLHPV
jgi:hypothetical protein